MRQGIAGLWRAIRTHKVWSTLAGVGLLGVLDFFGYLQTVVGLMQSVFGEHWFAIFMSSPWFKLASIAVTIFSLYRIAALSVREQRRASEESVSRSNTTETKLKAYSDQLTAVVIEQTAIVRIVANHRFLQTQVSAAESSEMELHRAREEFAVALAAIKNGERDGRRIHADALMPINGARDRFGMALHSLGCASKLRLPAGFIPQFRDTNPIPSEGLTLGGLPAMNAFRVENNDDWLAAQDFNLQLMQNTETKLAESLAVLRDELNAAAEAIDNHLQKSGG